MNKHDAKLYPKVLKRNDCVPLPQLCLFREIKLLKLQQFGLIHLDNKPASALTVAALRSRKSTKTHNALLFYPSVVLGFFELLFFFFY